VFLQKAQGFSIPFYWSKVNMMGRCKFHYIWRIRSYIIAATLPQEAKRRM
jgi:hypothetical protein